MADAFAAAAAAPSRDRDRKRRRPHVASGQDSASPQQDVPQHLPRDGSFHYGPGADYVDHILHAAAAENAEPHMVATRDPRQGHAGVQLGMPDSSAFAQDPNISYRNRARRKASERPQAPGQVRQSFSKRKRGLIQKAYQLHRITDAKVFVFCVNEKGASWAYATPGFGAALHPAHLKLLRRMADTQDGIKATTETMGHPGGEDVDDLDDWGAAAHAQVALAAARRGHCPGRRAMGSADVGTQVTPAHLQAGPSALHSDKSSSRQEAPLSFIADMAEAAYMDTGLPTCGLPSGVETRGTLHMDIPATSPGSSALHMGISEEDVATGTALGTPMEAPRDGGPAIGVPLGLPPCHVVAVQPPRPDPWLWWAPESCTMT